MDKTPVNIPDTPQALFLLIWTLWVTSKFSVYVNGQNRAVWRKQQTNDDPVHPVFCWMTCNQHDCCNVFCSFGSYGIFEYGYGVRCIQSENQDGGCWERTEVGGLLGRRVLISHICSGGWGLNWCVTKWWEKRLIKSWSSRGGKLKLELCFDIHPFVLWFLLARSSFTYCTFKAYAWINTYFHTAQVSSWNIRKAYITDHHS